jgi:hypothetical protein
MVGSVGASLTLLGSEREPWWTGTCFMRSRKKKAGTKNQTACANGTVRAALVGEGEEEVSF